MTNLGERGRKIIEDIRQLQRDFPRERYDGGLAMSVVVAAIAAEREIDHIIRMSESHE